jgi:CHASE2 domain-containing sensor protein
VLAGDQPLRGPVVSDLKVMVVDIDRASIDALGTWPWPRETMARLVEAVATGRPAAIAIDVLFTKPQPGGLLRSRSMCCSPSPTTARKRRSLAGLDW